MKLIFHKCTRKDIQTYSVKKKCGVRCTLNGTGIVSKDTLRINGLNRSDRKESFLSFTVPQMYRNIKIKEKKSIDTSLALKNPHLEIGITALVNLVPHYMASFIISQSVSFLRKFYTLPWSILAVQVWLVLRLDRYCVGLLLMFLFFFNSLLLSASGFSTSEINWNEEWFWYPLSQSGMLYSQFSFVFLFFFYHKKVLAIQRGERNKNVIVLLDKCQTIS